jgi:tetratricopeptide (TPR) repeat protein
MANELADQLGDLPLAIEQVAAYLEATDTPVESYLPMFRTQAQRLLADGHAVGYEHTIATVWSLSLRRIEARSPASVQLLTLTAFCAADAIPLQLFETWSVQLDPPLREIAADSTAVNRAVGMIVQYSLARRQSDTLQVHRLLQAAMRAQLSPDRADNAIRTVRRLLRVMAPTGDPETDTLGWPRWVVLLPHILEATTHEVAEVRGDDTENLIWLLNRAGRYLQTRAKLESSLPLHEMAVRLCEASYRPVDPRLAVELIELTWVLRLLGHGVEAHPLAERALKIYQTSYGPDHPKVVTTLVNLAQILRDIGKPADAYPQLQRALAIIEARTPPERRFSQRLPALAEITPSASPWDLPSTLALTRPLALDEAMYDPENPEVGAGVLVNVAQVLTVLGRQHDAYPLAKRALEVDQQSYGVDHPRVGSALVNLGLILRRVGRPAEAHAQLEHALAIYENSYGSDHPRVAGAFVNLGQVLLDLGRLREAEDYLERALEIFRMASTTNQTEVATALAALGLTLRDQGRLDKAHTTLYRALTIFRNAYGRTDSRTVSVLVDLIAVVQRIRRTDEASAPAQKGSPDTRPR